MYEDKVPIVIAIGGGKGTTGKSTVAASLAISIANTGKNIVLADLDFGGANLHTMLEIDTAFYSVVDFLYQPQNIKSLSTCITQTKHSNLKFLSGEGFQPGIANMEFVKKQKLIKSLKKLNCDMVVCDLGAGSSYNVVDFFLNADIPLLLLTPEPTAILNGYEFLKNCVFRKLSRYFSKDTQINSIINRFKNPQEGESTKTIQQLIENTTKVSPVASKQMDTLCKNFKPAVLLNKSKGNNKQIGDTLITLSKKYLNIDIEFLGELPEDVNINNDLKKMLIKQATITPFINLVDKVTIRILNGKFSEVG